MQVQALVLLSGLRFRGFKFSGVCFGRFCNRGLWGLETIWGAKLLGFRGLGG